MEMHAGFPLYYTYLDVSTGPQEASVSRQQHTIYYYYSTVRSVEALCTLLSCLFCKTHR